MGALFLPRRRPGARLRQLGPRVAAPAVMASPPVVTTAASKTLARAWYPATASAFYSMASSPGSGFFTVTRTRHKATGVALLSDPVVTGGTGAPNALGMLQVSFLHDGSDVELLI
jgi:hypothetical protein